MAARGPACQTEGWNRSARAVLTAAVGRGHGTSQGRSSKAGGGKARAGWLWTGVMAVCVIAMIAGFVF